MASASGSSLWSQYWPSFRFNVHHLIEWGYQDIQTFKTQAMEEEEITGCLVAAIQERLADPQAPEWTYHYNIKEDPPVYGAERTGKRRKRTDIVIESAMPRTGRPQFVFEAKNLRGSKYYTATRYIGKDGLQRYLRGEYAAAFPEAGMLGYVQSDTIEHWMDKIQAAINSDAKGVKSLALKGPLRAKVIVNGLPHEWVSTHDRHVGTPIIIYHVLLRCD